MVSFRRLTFRLDRFTGKVWQKVQDGEGDNKRLLWESMIVEEPTKSRSGHYQIFLSGVMAADTFLIDTDTGVVWRYGKDTIKRKDGKPDIEYHSWQRLEEESPLSGAENSSDGGSQPAKRSPAH